MIAAAIILAICAGAAPGPAPRERGVAIGLFSAEERFDYAPYLEEVRALGATHVALAYVLWQRDQGATRIRAISTWTPTDAQIVGAARAARSLGLHVTIFPILRLEDATAGQWRGTIAPSDEDAWWRSYGEVIDHAVDLALESGAERVAVGSELVSREAQRSRWLELIERTRTRAPALELMYSANWDHYRPVSFWDAVDVIGITGYFELTQDSAASTESMVGAWKQVIAELEAFSAGLKRPLVISEIGYPSIDGGARWPWDQSRKAPVDLDEQRRAYQAFTEALGGRAFLDGIYVWNWYGAGGPSCRDYTPRKKPAALVLERWYRSAASRTKGP